MNPINPIDRPEYASLFRKLLVGSEGGVITPQEVALFLCIATMADQLFREQHPTCPAA